MNTKHNVGKQLLVVSGLFAMAILCMAADDATTYSVPKNHPAMPHGIVNSGAPAFPVNTEPVHWTAPAGWQQLPATRMRLGSFLIAGDSGKRAEVAVTSFPGAVGTELDNVNRWRRELGLAPVEESAIVSEAVTIDSQAGKLYEFSGPKLSTVVVSLRRGENTWFFKLRGEKSVVDSAKPAFKQFLASVHFGGASTESTACPAVSNDGPKWSPPSTWTAGQPGPMVVKSFLIEGNEGQKATVAISVFPGNVGGTVANINRWRGQMGLAPIQESELPGATQSLPVEGGSAVLVDLTGRAAPAGQAGRLVAAIVPHNGSTWFYKLTGDGAVVAREKDGFVKFVQTARYP